MPGFGKNNYRCLYGEYSLAAALGRVWAVPSLPAFDAGWSPAGAGGLLRYKADEQLFAAVVTLPLQPLARSFSVDWTLVFSFDDGLSEAEAAAFIRIFTQRFEYFAALAKGFEDISFPAILENGKR